MHQPRDLRASGRRIAPGLRLEVRASTKAAFFDLDGLPCAFSELRQDVYQLDPGLARILASLEKPCPIEQLREEIAALLPGGVADFERLLLQWSEGGLVELVEPASDGSVTPAAVLPLPDGAIALHADDPAGEWLDAYSHLPSVGEHTHRVLGQISGELGLIAVSDGTSRIVPRTLLPAAFRFAAMQLVLASCAEVALHCACLVAEGDAILLLGRPGAGKSTLALFAAEHGFKVAGDDVGLFSPRDRTIMPLAMPLTLKSGSWGRLAETTRCGASMAPVPREDGVDVAYLPLPQPPSDRPLRIRALVQLDRREGGEAELGAWSKTDCLRHLCSEAKSRSGAASREDIEGFLAILEQAEILRLTYGDASEAARELGRRFAG